MRGTTTVNPKEAKIKARLEEALHSIFCPVGGCWCLHGGHYEYYYDEGCECHVLEVWPVGFYEPDEEGGNGRQRQADGVCYEAGESYCRLCEGGSKEDCACRGGEGPLAEGESCTYWQSGDVQCVGTCRQGVCEADPCP